MQFFATTPKGIETILASELCNFGAQAVKPGSAGVSFSGELSVAYRACLWSRVASRILVKMDDFPASDESALYHGIALTDWSQHFNNDVTLAINAHAAKSNITHSHFVAQRIKDAIVDQFRERTGKRPSVDRKSPDIRLNAYLFRNRLRLSLDISGDSLHRRNYRDSSHAAPLKENLAAAVLLHAGWPAVAERGGACFDPMCGSGTLLIEAAMIAYDIAPGLQRERWGFTRWLRHTPDQWQLLLQEARHRRDQGLQNSVMISGSDIDAKAVATCQSNVKTAGLSNVISISQRDIRDAQPIASSKSGLLVVNPPYGTRLNDEQGLGNLYSALGKVLRAHSGWRAGVFSANPDLAHRLRLPVTDSIALKNGDIDCKLQLFDIPLVKAAPKNQAERPLRTDASDPAAMFANRMRKNLKSLSGWARSSGVECYRVYDADLPEFNAAIDVFHCVDGETRVHLQEYAAPKTIDRQRAQERLAIMQDILPDLFACNPDNVFVKVRQRQRGDEQYEKLARRGEFHLIREADRKLLVNFYDYHDCGVFLDHRKVRQRIGTLASGKRFLNVFAYTAAASVHAAMGGATSTTSVDMSNSYLSWAKENFAANDVVGDQHQFVRADCVEWLKSERPKDLFDLILLDPPTFSNSKRMDGTWDVQRDHRELIDSTMSLLSPKGLLIFSTNRQRFKLDPIVVDTYRCHNRTEKTVPRDFSRTPEIHQCWEISHRDEQ